MACFADFSGVTTICIHGPCASPQHFPFFPLFNILLFCPEIKGSSKPSFFTSPISLVSLLEMKHKQTNYFTST